MAQPIQKQLSNTPLLGIFFMALAIFLFNTVNIIVKDQADAYPIGQILFFRNLFGLVPAFIIMFLRREKGLFKIHKPGLHLKRALFGTIGLLGIFLSLKLLVLAEAAAIFFTTSLFMTVLSPLLLKETVGLHRWIAVLIGFGAILWMKPPTNLLQIGAAIALAGSFFDALNMIFSRKLSHYEQSSTIHFYFTLLSAAFVTPLLFVDPGLNESWFGMVCGWKEMTWTFVAFMAVLGIGGSVAQFCITQANRHAQPSVIAPIIYTGIVWAIIFDFAIWGVAPTMKLMGGGGLVIISGLYIIWRERSVARQS